MRWLLAPLALLTCLACLSGCAGDSAAAKNFKLVPLDNPAKVVTLADFKGKTVLLDFWATWCGPCKNSMPEVQEIWDKYHGKGLEVVSITTEERNVVFRFHEDTGYTYPIYLDAGGAANGDYGIDSIPKFFLIKDGKIVWQSDGYDKKGDLSRLVADAMG